MRWRLKSSARTTAISAADSPIASSAWSGSSPNRCASQPTLRAITETAIAYPEIVRRVRREPYGA